MALKMYDYPVLKASISADGMWNGFCEKYDVIGMRTARAGEKNIVVISTGVPLDSVGLAYLALRSVGYDLVRS